MAKNDYSADSAPLPHIPSGPGLFNIPNVPASCLRDALPTIETCVLTGANVYIGETFYLARRLSEHVSVRQKTSPGGGSPTSISID